MARLEHTFRLYLPTAEDIGVVSLEATGSGVGQTFEHNGARYEILDVLDVPKAMGSQFVGVLTVTPLGLAEPG
jgi:hypothetical protein